MRGAGKALVFGPYPPSPVPEAGATVATVRSLLAEGVEVEVVSPEPSGAHRYADVRRLSGALRLAGWVAATPRVVLHLEPGIVLGWLDGRTLPPGRLALGLALRRPASVRVELAPIRGRLDDRSVRAVLGPAGRVVAASRFDRDILVAAGLPPGKVEVAAGAERESEPAPEVAAAPAPGDEPPASLADPGPWRLSPEPDRDEIQAEIRRRAAVRAGAGGTGGTSETGGTSGSGGTSGTGGTSGPGGATAAGESRAPAGVGVRSGPEANLPGTAASRPLLAIAPLGPAVARSPKPVVGLVKRAVRKLVGWQVDPVIEHVNRLHRATLEAIESQERGRSR